MSGSKVLIPQWLYVDDEEFIRVRDRLDSGGFGRVEHAKYRGKVVAVKTLHDRNDNIKLVG